MNIISTIVKHLPRPVLGQMFFEDTTRKTKEKLAFLFLILLPLGLGIEVLYVTLGVILFLMVVKSVDARIALAISPDKTRVLRILRDVGRGEEALVICGDDFHEKILSLRAVARIKTEQGLKLEAIKLLEEACSLFPNSPYFPSPGKTTLPKDYERVMEIAETMNELATLLLEQPVKDDHRIESLFEESLKMGRSTVTTKDPRVTLWLMNLGIFKQQELGKLNEALALFEEVLEVRKAVLGNNDPLVAQWMVNMAYLLLSRSDANTIGDRIESLVQGALTIRKTLYGADNVHVAESLNDCALMAALTAKDGDEKGLKRAREYGQQSLATYERVLGKNHPTTIKSRADWG